MGLDQYAYVASKAGQMNEHYKNYDYDKDSSTVAKPREIAYWRKHPNLQGWMEQLAERKNLEYDSFNGVELELTWEDIDMLEDQIKQGKVSELGTTGFFFGDPSDEYYKDTDLQFCTDAKAELFLGLKVFYNSSW